MGLIQTRVSVEHGTWYARLAEFMQTPTMATLRWMRVVDDALFAIVLADPGWFVVGLKTGWSTTKETKEKGPVFRQYPTRNPGPCGGPLTTATGARRGSRPGAKLLNTTGRGRFFGKTLLIRPDLPR